MARPSRGWGAPTLSSRGTPVLGGTFDVVLDGGPREVLPVALHLGLSKTTWSGLPLPATLAPIAPGCSVYASGEFVLPSVLTSGTGSLTMTLGIPNAPILLNTTFYNQFFVLDLRPGSAALITTNAGQATIGDV